MRILPFWRSRVFSAWKTAFPDCMKHWIQDRSGFLCHPEGENIHNRKSGPTGSRPSVFSSGGSYSDIRMQADNPGLFPGKKGKGSFFDKGKPENLLHDIKVCKEEKNRKSKDTSMKRVIVCFYHNQSYHIFQRENTKI